MLRYIFLVVMGAPATGNVLRYNSRVDLPSIQQPGMASRPEHDEQIHHNHQLSEEAGFREVAYINCTVTFNGIANCSNQGITNLEQLYQLSSRITGLDLSFNNIRFIDNGALARFNKLQWLNMSHNNLHSLSNDSFVGLSNLQVLHLQNNNLSMSPWTFPLEVFVPLRKLQQLHMENNTHVNDTELNYPHEALASLTSLTSLYMDGLPNKILGTGFQSMTSLTKLIMKGSPTGQCNLQSLPRTLFQYVTRLKYLDMTHCLINGKHVDPGVFSPLANLTYLDVSYNPALRFEPLGTALKAFKDNYNLKVLKMTAIVNPYSPGLCVTTEFATSLPRHLEKLYASSNSIETLDMNVMQNLPTSLTLIDVSSNKFVFWPYLKELNKLPNLKVLILNAGYVFDLPRYYPRETHVVNQCKETVLFTVDNKTKEAEPDVQQPLPPKLQEIICVNAKLSNHLTEFHFDENNTLLNLILDYNTFPVVRGPIRGLNKLKKLSMFGCKIQEMYPSFFQYLGSLEFLNLSYNILGNMALGSNQSLFTNLINLEVLDLSFNDIKHISRNAFDGLDNLKVLLLQRNPIVQFATDISHMSNLQLMNLSNTNLAVLPDNVTSMLDAIKQNSTDFILDFSHNSVYCFCSNIQFVEWLSKTTVLASLTSVACTLNNGYQKNVNNFEQLHNMLLKQCAYNGPIFAVVICTTLVLILVIIGAIIFRFRWKLRYLYYSALIHYKRLKNDNRDNSFEYDVFVSYAHEDHEFVEDLLYSKFHSRGLKVHIHGLHFIAGNFITSNIVDAVKSSRRTLVVLTHNLVNSYWSRYEIQMANMEQDYTGRAVLMFLILGDVPQLPNEIRIHLARNTYIEFPQSDSSQREYDLFWSKLISDLKS